MSWKRSRIECKGFGGDLAAIENDDIWQRIKAEIRFEEFDLRLSENMAISTMAEADFKAKNKDNTLRKKVEYWTAANDLFEEGDWTWIHGNSDLKKLNVTFTNQINTP